jgi:3-deoxy-7-phosphoheptulonate synthase
LAGLKLLKEVGDRTGLLIVSEVMEISQIDLMLPYVDVLQVGARNMQNFNLLRELGMVRKPVLLKRGIAATLEELLLSAEYILAGGNYDVMLCERGIRTFETYTRNTMDISAIPVIKKLSHLPMLADPSHGTGRRDKVAPMARAAVAAGCDGLLIEVHPNPDKAVSDGAQSLFPEQFDKLMDQRSGGRTKHQVRDSCSLKRKKSGGSISVDSLPTEQQDCLDRDFWLNDHPTHHDRGHWPHWRLRRSGAARRPVSRRDHRLGPSSVTGPDCARARRH